MNTRSPTVDLTRQLVRRASVTPDDAGCQRIIGRRLKALGFTVEHLRFGAVSNLWAVRQPRREADSKRPLLVLAGHTDVVPAGDKSRWHFPPFSAAEADGFLWGRGAADMKGGLAAMVTAVERFLTARPQDDSRLAFLVTSDEEGAAIDGTRRVLEVLEARGTAIDYCLLGEPSSAARLGDTIKIGRRGSLHGYLTLRGVQGHVAYPDKARNPIHQAMPALAELTAIDWGDEGGGFPATGLQISYIEAGGGADGAHNVIPGELRLHFNLRYSPGLTVAAIKERIGGLLTRHGLDFELQWELSGEPFLTKPGALIDAVSGAVQEVTGSEPKAATDGGTSDGRFIAKSGAQVVELGVVNTHIHQVDERVRLADLDELSHIYEQVLCRLADVSY